MALASHLSRKMKRKELDEVNEDFSDFSLSSPACKIRRLDAELPPIIEEEEELLRFQPPQRAIQDSDGVERQLLPSDSVTANQERAIVLFKPYDADNTLYHHAPSNFCVDSTLISNFKNEALRHAHSRRVITNEDEEEMNSDGAAKDNCLAVVPWVPTQQLQQRSEMDASDERKMPDEAMDVEGGEATTMDIEENDLSNEAGYNASVGSDEGLQHLWQQQHCMIRQPLQNAVSPIVWYR